MSAESTDRKTKSEDVPPRTRRIEGLHALVTLARKRRRRKGQRTSLKRDRAGLARAIHVDLVRAGYSFAEEDVLNEIWSRC